MYLECIWIYFECIWMYFNISNVFRMYLNVLWMCLNLFKIKSQLYELTLKQYINLAQTPRIAQWGPQSKKRPKKVKDKSHNLREHRKQKLFSYINKPQRSVWTIPQPPKLAILGPQKTKTTPKLGWNLKSEIMGS